MRRPPPLSELIHYPVTGGVCLLAIVTYLCGLAGYNTDPLVVNYLALHGQPWRLVTTIFPHANFLHLAFNLSWIWVFGAIIETKFGSIRTGVLILILAAAPCAAEYAFTGSCIGLSGVVYGMFGFLWVLSRYDRSLSDVVDSRTVWMFVVWFFLCIALTVSEVLPVGNVAHGVGCLLGVIIGFAIAAPLGSRWLARIGLGVCMVLIGLAATIGRPFVNFTIGAGGELADMAYTASENNDNARSARLLEKAVAYRRTDPRWWFNLYVAYLNLGRHGDAVAALKRAPMLDPESRKLKGRDLAGLGEEAMANNDFRGAADLFKRAIKAGQENEATWRELGTAYARLGQAIETADAFRHAEGFKKSAPADTQSIGS